MDIVTYYSIMGVVIAFGSGALMATQKIVKPEANQRTANIITGLDTVGIAGKFPEMVEGLFSSIFGDRHFSYKCISRSIIASIFIYLVLLLMVASIIIYLSDLSYNNMVLVLSADLGSDSFWIFALYAMILFSALNLLPDYLSLLETRIIIKSIPNSSLRKVLLYLFIDLLATIVIYLTFFSVLVYSTSFIPDTGIITLLEPFNLLKSIYYDFYKLIIFINYYDKLGTGDEQYEELITSLLLVMTFITTFATSFWIWLMVASTLLLKFMQKRGGPIWDFLFNRFLDTNNKPFQAMAYVWGLFVIVGFVVASPFVFLIA